MASSPSPSAHARCTADSACALAASDWCVAARTCDLTFGECVTWPRCVSDPWLGCLSEAQRCVSVRLLAATTHESTPGLVVAVIVVVIGVVGALALVLGCRAAKRHGALRAER